MRIAEGGPYIADVPVKPLSMPTNIRHLPAESDSASSVIVQSAPEPEQNAFTWAGEESYVAELHEPARSFRNTLPWRSWEDVPWPNDVPAE